MKRFLVTICLLVLFAASVFILIVLYISGPNIKYEVEMKEEIELIQQNSQEEFTAIQRHVFRYVTYIGETQDAYIWFDREGKQLLSKPKNQIHMKDAMKKANELYALENVSGRIGYGYDNGTYVLENESYIVMLDIDSLEEIYYQRK